jgi:hypothetical protein
MKLFDDRNLWRAVRRHAVGGFFTMAGAMT